MAKNIKSDVMDITSDDNQEIILKHYIVKLRVTIKMGKQNI